MFKINLDEQGNIDQIDVPGLHELSYLALHWRSPYFVNILVRGAPVMKPYTAL